MEFDFIEFLDKSKSTCRSKLEFAERIQNEVEAVSKINSGSTYLDRLIYIHQLELASLTLKSGGMLKEGKFNAEIMDLIDSL